MVFQGWVGSRPPDPPPLDPRMQMSLQLSTGTQMRFLTSAYVSLHLPNKSLFIASKGCGVLLWCKLRCHFKSTITVPKTRELSRGVDVKCLSVHCVSSTRWVGLWFVILEFHDHSQLLFRKIYKEQGIAKR